MMAARCLPSLAMLDPAIEMAPRSGLSMMPPPACAPARPEGGRRRCSAVVTARHPPTSGPSPIGTPTRADPHGFQVLAGVCLGARSLLYGPAPARRTPMAHDRNREEGEGRRAERDAQEGDAFGRSMVAFEVSSPEDR